MDTILVIFSILFSLSIGGWLVFNMIRAFRYKNPNGRIFHGGAWVGLAYGSWPFGVLIISKDSIVLKIEGMPSDYELIFTKENLEKIAIQKYMFGIKFTPRPYRLAWFWYWPFSYRKLKVALKEYGWI